MTLFFTLNYLMSLKFFRLLPHQLFPKKKPEPIPELLTKSKSCHKKLTFPLTHPG